jgi:uncharacterized DUF497 family protein
MGGPIFEWDEEKAEANLRKHGVPFAFAASVFSDPDRLEEDDRFAEGEYRTRVIGIAGVRHLTVVYTDRSTDDEEVVRIISARRSTPHEIKKYHANR